MSLSKRLSDFFNKYTSQIHSGGPRTDKGIEWIANDFESTFKENIKKYPQYLQYYVDNPITYRVNKQYFRSTFDFKPSKKKKVNLFIGCSHTFGIGLHWKHTWPYLLSQNLDEEIINLGVPGGCIEVSYINLKKYIDYFDVQNVFHLQPVYARYLAFWNNKLESFISTQEHIFRVTRKWFKNDYIKQLFHDPDYMVYSHFKSLDAIKYICKEKNIPYFYNHSIPEFAYPSHFKNNKKTLPEKTHQEYLKDILARDMSHPPLSSTKKIASKFLDLYKKHPEGFSTL